MADTTGVLARLQAALSVYDPSWDVSVGSATYKILESVAQEIAYANNNSVLQTYSYDINTKSGTELDTFVNLFGIYRQLGKRATGAVAFSLNAPSSTIINIPVGTQVSVPVGTNYPSAIIYSTTAPAIIGQGDTTTLVPVTASLPGSYANVPANTVSSLVSVVNGGPSVTNPLPIMGGTSPESDATLQSRWTNTVFSNSAGTAGNYAITALQDPNVTLVNAIGQQNFYSEQLQVQSLISGTANAGSITFSLVAYSGQTINNVLYSGTSYVASSGFLWSTTASSLQNSLNTMISGAYPALATSSNFLFTVTNANSTNTLASGLYINANMASPYRLLVSGSNLVSSGTNAGAFTFSGSTASGSTYTFYDYIVSNNPDVGYSGTLSFNGLPGTYFGTSSGIMYPQGNELLGYNLNTSSQTTFSNKVDYFYPYTPSIPLKVNVSNGTNNPYLFIGNTPQFISEYNAASSRSLALTSGNYADIFINGTNPSVANEQTVLNTAFVLTSGNSINYLNTNNYLLANGSFASSNANVTNNYYIPLNVQPVISFPSQLGVAGAGYADTLYVYNSAISSGTVYPIATNPASGIVTFWTGPVSSNQIGGTFLPLSGTFPGVTQGMIISANNVLTSGTQYYVNSVTSSGVYLNAPITATGALNASFSLSGTVAFYPLFDNTNTQGSVLSINGIGLNPSAASISGWPDIPTGINWINYSHAYNNDVTTVETLTQQVRPFGSNTLVHQSNFVNIVPNVRIVFSNGYSISTAQSNILNQLNGYFSRFTYLGTISFAEIAAQMLASAGVANVRVNSVSVVSLDGTVINTYTKDFQLASNQLPNVYNVNYTIAGASNF